MPARQALEATCAEEIDTIKAELDKKSKSFSKADKGAKSQEALFKGLLGKR